MNTHHKVGGKSRETSGFILIAAFLSLCGSSVAYTNNQCDTPIQGSPPCPSPWAGANGTYYQS